MDEFVCPEGPGGHFPILIQKHLEAIEKAFGLEVALRGDKVMYSGNPAQGRKFKKYLQHLAQLQRQNGRLREHDLQFGLDLAAEGRIEQLPELADRHLIRVDGKEVFPKTVNQRIYVDAIDRRDMVFGIGPAGTGKTFLAIAMALNFLIAKRVERIVLTRPVVEAGEKLGFLPGDLIQKVNPYLRPLYDALFDLCQYDQANRLIERGVIEIAPLAFMRGRTLNGAFIILDEAQNTTREQMKMILTRAGFDSKLVITADITQIDLPQPRKSGVLQAMKILISLPEIAFVQFNDRDVVRHPLVQKIIKAYQKAETRES